MRRSKVIVGVCGDVVPQVAMVGPAQASKGPARRSCQSRTAGLQRPSNTVSLLRSGRRYASVAAYRSAPNVEHTSSNVNVAGASAATVRARASFARPRRNDGDHRATRCPERCHLSSRGAHRETQASPAFIRATPRDRRQQAARAARGLRAACVPASLGLATRRGVRP